MEFNSELVSLMKKVTGVAPEPKTATINIIPGIDWSKEDIVLVSNAGKEHTFKKPEELSKNFIKIQQGYGHKGVALKVLDDYISVKKYEGATWGTFTKVDEAKERFEAEGKLHLYHTSVFSQWNHLVCDPEDGRFNMTFDDMEVRIYKDCRIALIFEIELAGEKIYYTLSKDIVLNPEVVAFKRKLPVTDPINASLFDVEIRKSADQPYAIRIYNDKDARDNSYKFGSNIIRKEFLASSALQGGYALEASGARYLDRSRYWDRDCRAFEKETLEAIEKFFDLDAPKLKYAKERFESKYGVSTIKTIEDVFEWVGLMKTETSSPEATKTEIGKMLREFVNPEWEDTSLEDENGVAVWARHNEWIILGYAGGTNRCSWGYGRNNKKIFAYNTNTKVRFYGETVDDGEHWAFPIPGCDYIDNAFALGEVKDGSITYKRKQIIKDGVSLRTLFDKSNVAWILDNPEALECEVKMPKDNGSYWEKEVIKVKDQLSEDYIGVLALHILTTTGNPALEMMLKSRLFNMYFYGIECLREKEFGSSFLDLDKRAGGKVKTRSEWDLKNAAFVYHSKEKNLKKMFGWNFNILREVDKASSYETVHFDYGGEEYMRLVPKLWNVDKCIGADLATLDPLNIQTIVRISKSAKSRYSYRSTENVWCKLGDLILKNTPRCTPKVRLQYIDACKECIDIYEDYLEARGQLVDYALKHPEDAACDEKAYPIQPKSAQKFIPYFSKLGFLDRYWGSCEGSRSVSEKDFKRDLEYKYEDAFKEGRAVIERNPFSGISGCFIKMTPEEHIQFLHDEVSQMAKFFTSDVDQKDFEKAVKRVDGTQWRDSETGLEIIAPKFVKDIIREGAELDHCVGTYVNAILGGRENIVFLRRIDMPDSPYYTVELLDDGMGKGRFDIGEVHCYRNGNTEFKDQDKAFSESGLVVYNRHFNIMKFLARWCAAKSHLLNRRNIDSGDIKKVAKEAIGGTAR